MLLRIPPLMDQFEMLLLENGLTCCGSPLLIMPGERLASMIGFRLLSGRSSMRAFSMTMPRSTFSTSSSGSSLDTVTLSAMAPTSSTMSMPAACATWSCMLSRSKLLNPGMLADSLYVPGFRNMKRYWPTALLCVVNDTPVSVLVSFSVAPAATAPDGSVTVPLRLARVSWAMPAAAASTSATKGARPLLDTIPPPWS